MSDTVSANWTTLLNQAAYAPHLYMTQAKENIDKLFGEGYAKQNPQLVAAYIQVAATDFQTAAIAIASQNIQYGLKEIAESLNN
jgi:hypothetical protein